ncbi:HAMP domain-containing protein, partial [Acetobacter orientalis]
MKLNLPLSFHHLKGRLRSVGLQFALAYGALFIGSALLFLSFVWWGTVGLIERQTERSITADAKVMLQTAKIKGHSGVVGLLNERLEQDVDDNALYLLVSPEGQWIAGNLLEWPQIIRKDGVWYSVPVKRVDLENMAKVKAFTMPDGDRLLIGRDMSGHTLLSHMLTEMLLWTFLMVSLLAIGGGWLTRRMLRRIIASISRTTQAITQGDMSRRLPVQGRDKEIDEVAHTINEMLDRTARLMDGVKQVSNSIAHDLRTPITRARTQLEDASANAETAEELRTAIDQTVRNLDHLTDVCAALLRIAQIEAGARRSAFA